MIRTLPSTACRLCLAPARVLRHAPDADIDNPQFMYVIFSFAILYLKRISSCHGNVKVFFDYVHKYIPVTIIFGTGQVCAKYDLQKTKISIYIHGGIESSPSGQS